MTKEPDMSSIYIAQLGALEAELERVNRENIRLDAENRDLRNKLYSIDSSRYEPEEFLYRVLCDVRSAGYINGNLNRQAQMASDGIEAYKAYVKAKEKTDGKG